MKRFDTIEDAREYLSYTAEDIAEVDSFILRKEYTMALNVLESMTKNCEFAAREYPEMESEVALVIPMISKRIMSVIRQARRNQVRA